MKLLEDQDYRLIEQLSLAVRRRVTGMITGEQRSPAQSGGIEFADYREYQPGDDVRRIDWSVFLRLRRLLTKICAEEKELTLIAMLDISRSMRYGQPDKLWVAGRVAAVLAGIALHGGNRAGVVTMGERLREVQKPQSNRVSLVKIVCTLANLEPEALIDPVAHMREFAARYGRKCLVVFLSDLLYPNWQQTISGLAASGSEGHIIQIMCPEELDPPHLGEVTLVDVESGGEVPLHAGQELIGRYRRELARYLRDVRQTCHRHGLGHALIPTDASLARIFHANLRQEGLIC